jgi:hypothetical protein
MMYQSCELRLSLVTCPAHKKKPTELSTQPITTGRFAPMRSSMRPPICAAITNPMKM